jgi:hypothetical protein
MPSVTMNGSRPRNETSQPFTRPIMPPTARATSNANHTEKPPNRPAQSTAASPSAEPTLISMPPVRTMINSAITTTPMIDIWSSRLVMLVPVRKAGLDSAAMISSTIRMNRAYWPFSHSRAAFRVDCSGCCSSVGVVAVVVMYWLLRCGGPAWLVSLGE